MLIFSKYIANILKICYDTHEVSVMDKGTSYRTDFFEVAHSLTEKPDPASFSLHTHQKCEFYYFISGKGVFHIEGTDYPLKPGNILIMNNTESHYIEIDPNHPYERLAIHFDKNFIKRIDLKNDLLTFFEDRDPGENNLVTKESFDTNLYLSLINNIQKSIETDDTRTLTNFIALLSELKKAYLKNMAFESTAKKTLVNRIINYILSNIENDISLDDICDEFYICKSQLCTLFKKTMGVTVWSFITLKRLTLAKKLLEAGYTPTETYSKCGFGDYSSFYRAYKKHFGISPKNNNPPA